jgi:hypothetical protein
VYSDARYRAAHSQLLQDVADRVERGTKRWFSGICDPLYYTANTVAYELGA